jgi:dimethylhistidine N-methyltransferase
LTDIPPDQKPRLPRHIAAVHVHGPPSADFRARFLAGLARPNKSIAAGMLFDRRSPAFRRLCTLPEYYIERCELEILHDHAVSIALALGEAVQLIDMGQGFGPQVAQLLGTLHRPWGYVAIDRELDALLADAQRVQARYPRLWVEAVCADMWAGFDLPSNAGGGRRAAYLPGNAIGNMDPSDALVRLKLWAGELRRGALMLIGVDLRKSVLIVESAYDDPHGLNAALMHDMLRWANRELDADFDIRLFEHRVHFDAVRGRVRADLVSIAQQDVRVGDRIIHFDEGEPIHVGDSWKYSLEDFQAIARGAGFRVVKVWLDSHEMFSLHLLAVT